MGGLGHQVRHGVLDSVDKRFGDRGQACFPFLYQAPEGGEVPLAERVGYNLAWAGAHGCLLHPDPAGRVKVVGVNWGYQN